MQPFSVTVMASIVGDVAAGKNYQATKIFNAQDEDGNYPFRPCLFLTSDTSGRVSSADLIKSPDCLHVEVTSPEDLHAALKNIEQGHNGRRFAFVFFDGWSTLQENAKSQERARASEKSAADNRVMAALVSPRMRSAMSAWTAASQSEAAAGALFLSTCHVNEEWKQRPGSKSIDDRYRAGLKADISSAVYDDWHRSCNAIIYLTRLLPDFSAFVTGDSLDDLDANLASLTEHYNAGAVAPIHLSVTRAGILQGDELRFVKWQDGLFRPDLPPVGRSPDLGREFLSSPLRLREA